MFDRDWEWDTLTRFALDPAEGATLGIVAGRRRQGKSFLLEELCARAGGFYFMATEATTKESLDILGTSLAEHVGAPAPYRFTRWEDALDALLGVASERPAPVVIDEFPYLCRPSPELPSVVQKALGPRRHQRLASRSRLILCGSAVSFMGRLLGRSAPLRGRVGLDLVVQTFGYREAARYWDLDDWWLALNVHAIVGGTPAYRREYVRGDTPRDGGDFDAWVCRTVLDPSCPLFKEPRYLLSEESDVREPSLYHSVLAGVTAGHTTRAGIANYVGRPADTLGHPITVLEDTGLLVREQDMFRKRRSTYRIAEPLLVFYHAVMRPEWGRLERPGRAREVWQHARARFHSTVLGPHYEAICREWLADAFDPGDGRVVARVGAGVVADPVRRTGHEVDLVARDGEGRLLALGEAKLGERMDLGHRDRLHRIRALLAEHHGEDVEAARLVCCSAKGFTPGLQRAAAEDDDLVLVDLPRLYGGS